MVTPEELHQIMIYAPMDRINLFVGPFNDAMREFEIDTPLREAAFIAQVAHESGECVYTSEIASGEAYNGRSDLGNTKPEAIKIASDHGSTPGPWWKGHGLIQITGYDNHLSCGEALGLDLLNNPSLITEPVGACRSAAWFWKTHGLNELADDQNMALITRRINGGMNGFDDRMSFYNRALKVIGA